MRKRLKKAGKVLLVVGAVVALITAALFGYLAYEDAQHAKFFRAGRSINEFLSDYSHSLVDAYSQKDVQYLTRHYSDNYHSPVRGRWLLEGETAEGDVAVSRLRPEGEQTFKKSDLSGELRDR